MVERWQKTLWAGGVRLPERFLWALLCVVLAMLLSLSPVPVHAQDVKKSENGICHCPGGSYYARTKAFTAYPTLEACLAEGGRPPQRGQGQCPHGGARLSRPADVPPAVGLDRGSARAPAPYNRDLFGGWNDSDRDGCDTRAELLMAYSVAATTKRGSGCTVARGQWLDPYTGRRFTDASDLDIDHLVPLSWAWDRGAWSWDQSKRELFANDPANLFIVHDTVNRQKSDSGPLEWLPPDGTFHCQYVTRFERVVRTYGLALSVSERSAMDRQRATICR